MCLPSTVRSAWPWTCSISVRGVKWKLGSVSDLCKMLFVGMNFLYQTFFNKSEPVLSANAT